MKKLILLVVMGLLVSVSGFAQKSNRTKAYLYLDKGQLDKAKEAIDEAVKNEKTKTDAKTWLFYGEVYYGIASSPLPIYKKLDSLAAEKALSGLQNVKKYDDKGHLTKEADDYIGKLSPVFYQQGNEAFKVQNYADAMKNFADAYRVGKLVGKTDTTAVFNAGISALLAKNSKMAAKYLKASIDDGYNDAKAYVYYTRALKDMGDTTAANEALEQGRKAFPDDMNLLLEQAQMYLEKGQSKQLIQSLKEAIAKEPNSPSNANLYFLIGKSYDDLKDVAQAEENYKKSLAINPNFFASYYNIGAIYVNNAAVLQRKANSLPLSAQDEYTKLNDEANSNLKIAVPWLEKALKLKPTDEQTLKALKEAYTRLKMNDKLKDLMNN
ncbi:MAG: tetratricopeptide repeat protein [Bacteroidales bacterium]|nr:tetratricopeptide repeat protein [Bacteroidales bacterium]